VESCILKNKEWRQGKLNIDLTYIFVTCINQVGQLGSSRKAETEWAWAPPPAGRSLTGRWFLPACRDDGSTANRLWHDAQRRSLGGPRSQRGRRRTEEAVRWKAEQCDPCLSKPKRCNTQGVLGSFFFLWARSLDLPLTHMELGPLASWAQCGGTARTPQAGAGLDHPGRYGPKNAADNQQYLVVNNDEVYEQTIKG
jgi:hypothetical protein